MTRPVPAALHHTGFVVRDLEETAQRLADAFGIGPWHVWTIQPAESRQGGKPIEFSFRVALATVGGGTFELLAPHGGTVFDEWLNANGPGFHHTCLVYPTLEAVQAAKADLQRQGREMVLECLGGDAFEFGYFRFPEIGSLVEVLYLNPEALSAPEAVIEAGGA